MSTSKTIVKPVVVANAVAISANYTSAPFSFERYSRASLEIIFTGTLTGTVQIQMSDDYVPSGGINQPQVLPAASWYDSPLSFNALSGSGDSYFIDFTQTGVPWIRVNYTHTAGAGTITIVVTAKED